MSTDKTHAEAKAVRRPVVPRRIVFWAAGLLWVVVALWFISPPPPEWVERAYAHGLYPWVAALLHPVNNGLPFSLAGVMMVSLAVLLVVTWAVRWWRYARQERPRAHLHGALWGPKVALVLTPLVLCWFIVAWGAGYRRPPIEDRLGLDTAAATGAEAAALRQALLEIIREDGGSEGDVDAAVRSLSRSLGAVLEAWDGRAIALPQRVKATPPGLLLMNGTSGICAPLTLEAHVDGGLPDAAFVSTAAHELAHIGGICREAEASFAGYAAGIQADNAYARYAVALFLYQQLLRGLDAEAWTQALDALPEGAQEDLRRTAEAAKRYRIDWFQKASWRTYDTYLKSQGIAEGVRNYDRGTTLFVGAWRKGLVKIDGARPEGQAP